MTAFAQLDAVTIDGYGTLLELDDPVGHLDRALRERGVQLPEAEIERGLQAEIAYYSEHKLAARDTASLAELRVRCAAAFLDEVGLDLDPQALGTAFAFEFVVIGGAAEAVAALGARGLALAVVANWDVGLHEQLGRAQLRGRFDTVVTAAEVGAGKPDPLPFQVALERLGIEARRAVHVGDHAVDEEGAAAAGLGFRPAPLATAFEGWS